MLKSNIKCIDRNRTKILNTRFSTFAHCIPFVSRCCLSPTLFWLLHIGCCHLLYAWIAPEWMEECTVIQEMSALTKQITTFCVLYTPFRGCCKSCECHFQRNFRINFVSFTFIAWQKYTCAKCESGRVLHIAWLFFFTGPTETANHIPSLVTPTFRSPDDSIGKQFCVRLWFLQFACKKFSGYYALVDLQLMQLSNCIIT